MTARACVVLLSLPPFKAVSSYWSRVWTTAGCEEQPTVVEQRDASAVTGPPGLLTDVPEKGPDPQ